MNCAYCGAPLAQSGKGRPRRFCGDFCRRAEQQGLRATREGVQKPQTCARCGIEIEQAATGRPRRFCSEACRLPKRAQNVTGAS